MRRIYLRGTWMITSSPGLFANANSSTDPDAANSARCHPVVNATCELLKRNVTFCVQLAACGRERKRREERIKAKT